MSGRCSMDTKTPKEKGKIEKVIPHIPPRGYGGYTEEHRERYRVFRAWIDHDGPYRREFIRLIRGAYIESRMEYDDQKITKQRPLEKIRRECIWRMYRQGIEFNSKIPLTHYRQNVYMYCMYFDDMFNSMIDDYIEWRDAIRGLIEILPSCGKIKGKTLNTDNDGEDG